mmetsp:Transcript_9236/g.39160  ORF Transcript_9236/g.39160 Transcript_9236/m.39160 type:complete len:264 (-) Transcript_9236:1317-2108(-)
MKPCGRGADVHERESIVRRIEHPHPAAPDRGEHHSAIARQSGANEIGVLRFVDVHQRKLTSSRGCRVENTNAEGEQRCEHHPPVARRRGAGKFVVRADRDADVHQRKTVVRRIRRIVHAHVVGVFRGEHHLAVTRHSGAVKFIVSSDADGHQRETVVRRIEHPHAVRVRRDEYHPAVARRRGAAELPDPGVRRNELENPPRLLRGAEQLEHAYAPGVGQRAYGGRTRADGQARAVSRQRHGEFIVRLDIVRVAVEAKAELHPV